MSFLIIVCLGGSNLSRATSVAKTVPEPNLTSKRVQSGLLKIWLTSSKFVDDVYDLLEIFEFTKKNVGLLENLGSLT